MPKAVFTRGSPTRHIIVMTGASAVGLLTLFTVDLVDMYFLSLLGEEELAAAIGFSGTLLFFLTAVSIGLQIAMGALVARSEGAHDRQAAGDYCTNVMVFSFLVSATVCLPAWWYLEQLLGFLGAEGRTLGLAMSYSEILLPSTPLLAVGMGAAAALRSVGDARRSMYALLGGAFANALLDPVFIFGFGWGIQGAAVASLAARIALLAIGLRAIFVVHHLPTPFAWHKLRRDMRAILPIAGPALLTNLATPLGASYVLKTMATFGDSAVAGAAILGRITPVAFAAVFSLSSAIGPIVGQNAGAGMYQRVRQTLVSALLLNIGYCLLVWLLLYLLTGQIVSAFAVSGDAAELIAFYTRWLVGGFMFVGMLFVANATFNNLHRAYFATAFNFARMLCGTVPLVYLFSRWFGAPGVLAGELAGAVVFGTLAYVTALWFVGRVEQTHQPLETDYIEPADDAAQWPFSSPRTQLGQRYTRPEDLD
jgi:putative MATE family efflux protein